MVEHFAGSPIGGVNRTEEVLGLWEQLAHRSGAHLTEEGSTVHTAEVGQVTKVVQLVCNNSEPRLLEGDYEGGRGRRGGREGEREGERERVREGERGGRERGEEGEREGRARGEGEGGRGEGGGRERGGEGEREGRARGHIFHRQVLWDPTDVGCVQCGV